ncbi:MAG: beta-lactamase family protein [Flavobacteriaceae bacterium]|jgi:CubicO group peptidase (beta-lactamase class C family)|nr:beta-lactamase family protein [Flavobacteriaceae bacterium]
MSKILKWFFIIITSLVLLLYAFNLEYLIKGVRTIYLTGNNTAFISDYEYFDNRDIKSLNPQPWALHKKYNTVSESYALQNLNAGGKTKSFLVIKNDSILFEKYYDGYDQNSLSNSFSVAKSIVTSMMGKAIMEGKIKGLDQPVSDYFEEYKEGLASVLTVGDLATMSSGMDWSEKYYSVINITSESYFTKDLRSVILRQKIIDKPGQGFRYSSGDTQLLGMVIEKATGVSLSEYLSEKFWKPMGAENNALWQIDSENYGMEKAYCCIAATARDFARFGKLYINKGKWNDEVILDSSFVELSIQPSFKDSPYYGYGWWLYDYEGKKVFTMNGHRGQFVISFPEENIIIVRQGDFNEKGRVSYGTGDLYKYISEGYKLAKSIE